MGIKYNEQYAPYATDQAPNVEHQIIWLIKEGIPKKIISQALDKVYQEIQDGRVFEEEYITDTLRYSPTKVLWKYVRQTARRMYADSITLDEEVIPQYTKFQKIMKVMKGEL